MAKQIKTVHPVDDGYHDKMGSTTTTWRQSVKDLAGNHYQGQQDVFVVWELVDVELDDTDDKISKLIRYEIDGTGVGMTEDILTTHYFRCAAVEHDSRGVGQNNVGEQLGKTILQGKHITKDMRNLLNSHGHRVATKKVDDTEWMYVNWDRNTNKYLESGYYNGDDLEQQHNIPISEMGGNGTYSEYLVNRTNWGKNWIDEIATDIGTYFSEPLSNGRMTFRIRHIDVNGNLIKEVNIKPRLIPTDGWTKKRNFDFYGKLYEGHYGIRLKPDKDPKSPYQKWIANGNLPGLVGLENKRVNEKDPLTVIFRDKYFGFYYEIRQGSNAKHVGYSTLFIDVDTKTKVNGASDYDTTLEKAFGSLSRATHDKKGVPVSHQNRFGSYDTEMRKFYEWQSEIWPKENITEKMIEKQIYDMLTGVGLPSHITVGTYKEFVNDIGAKPFDFDFFKSLVRQESAFPSLDKLDIDMWNEDSEWMFEVTDEEPDIQHWHKNNSYILGKGIDDDGNFVVKKAITLGVSNQTTKTIMTKNSNFSDYTVGLFEKKMNNMKSNKLNTIEWIIIDLQYYGLDKIGKGDLVPFDIQQAA